MVDAFPGIGEAGVADLGADAQAGEVEAEGAALVVADGGDGAVEDAG